MSIDAQHKRKSAPSVGADEGTKEKNSKENLTQKEGAVK